MQACVPGDRIAMSSEWGNLICNCGTPIRFPGSMYGSLVSYVALSPDRGRVDNRSAIFSAKFAIFVEHFKTIEAKASNFEANVCI